VLLSTVQVKPMEIDSVRSCLNSLRPGKRGIFPNWLSISITPFWPHHSFNKSRVNSTWYLDKPRSKIFKSRFRLLSSWWVDEPSQWGQCISSIWRSKLIDFVWLNRIVNNTTNYLFHYYLLEFLPFNLYQKCGIFLRVLDKSKV
jgi:hypothetical protein